MSTIKNDHWNLIVSLINELRNCNNNSMSIATLVMSFVSIDTLANLGRPANQEQATRKDFISWVDTYLKADSSQVYQYKGKDVYAARCAVLHTLGTEASLHKQDPNIKIYGYHDGGRHNYNPEIDKNLILIGIPSFVYDIQNAAISFLDNCEKDLLLKKRVEERLPKVLGYVPIK